LHRLKKLITAWSLCWFFIFPLAACTSTGETLGTLEDKNIVAIVNGTLIDGTGAAPVRDAILLVQGDRILAAGPRSTVVVPKGVTEIDAGGGTILPGFINTHVHDGFNKDNLAAWARGGVTTVRDEGMRSAQNIKQQIDWRNEANQDLSNARLVSAGAMISVPGGYGQLHVASADDARNIVNEELDAGVDMIKVSLEDGYAGTSGLAKLSPEELAAIVALAHQRGVHVSGHITQAAYMDQMAKAGVDDIAHLAYDPVSEETIQVMVTQGIYLVPTFTVFRNYGAPVAACVQNLANFVRLGGRVALGNDYGGGPGTFELGIPMYEIEMMAQAGMTPMQIIQAGTLNAAYVVGLDSEIGTLEPGKLADILVVAGDPLQNLSDLARTSLVMHQGSVIFEQAE
jgi:imidazolonepropionase-like amidohydrolase